MTCADAASCHTWRTQRGQWLNMSLSVCVCWAQWRVMQKRMNWSSSLRTDSSWGPEEPCIKWGSRFPTGRGTRKGHVLAHRTVLLCKSGCRGDASLCQITLHALVDYCNAILCGALLAPIRLTVMLQAIRSDVIATVWLTTAARIISMLYTAMRPSSITGSGSLSPHRRTPAEK